ncbi:MAG: hypothetical protein GY940_45615, partial [bacterium]|nr:hypothetical protein [bacterium]
EFEGKFHLYLADRLDYNGREGELEKLNQNYADDVIIDHLRLLLPRLRDLEDFRRDSVENTVRQCAESNGLKAADFIHPARFALTSETVSPAIFDVFEFLGKEKSLHRIGSFIAWLETGKPGKN